MRISLILILFFFKMAIANGQEVIDTTATDPAVIEKVKRHSPAKATILSAVLPGAGQFYNKKYWKMPILYGGFAAVGYAIDFNQDRYLSYKNALQTRTDGDEATIDQFEGVYSEENLRTLKDFYRRNRDLTIIIGGIVYVLNIIDAHVDAHLFYFDVSDDLSMQLSPGLIQNPYDLRSVPGVSLSFNLH